MLKYFITSILVIALTACVTHQPKGYIKHVDNRAILKEKTQLYVKIPDSSVILIGKAAPSLNEADQFNMLYPAATPGDFFAGVIAHAIIVESKKNEAKNSAQAAADVAVLPYRPYLKDVANQALASQLENIVLARGFSLARYEDSQSESDIILDITPIFLMNQKQDTLTLRTQFLVYPKSEQHKSTKKRAVLYQNQIEVLSAKIDAALPQEYWLSNNGEQLVNTMRSLLSQTLALGAIQISSIESDHSNRVQHNFRYDDGDTTAFERASVISNDCNRVVINTLRGWLKSIPSERLKDKHICQDIQESTLKRQSLN
ncbi:hypothetical protein [Shewanella youngdeokensis]|uniref:Lipoprotein n=1 Tax=Shewanella youngdeokensis TaxID=2999068 RepID=A0ABZ0JUY1_9GAMM|nr:hypothetical protein RGE70_12335 [Shewanella sp. DAU334]